MKRIIFFALISFMLFISSANAQVWTSDFLGNVKRTFYNTNDTVYLSSTAIFTPTTNLRVYIVNDNNSWVNQTALTDVRGNYTIVQTNSSGAIDRKDFWDPKLTVGTFDIAVDVNGNGVYDSGTCGTNDCVYSLTETGFTVLKTPQPVISAGYGSYNPINHNWAYDPTNPYNVMMNLKLTGDTEENVKLNSVYLSAVGTGNDKKGITVVRIIKDDNSNGLYDTGDTLVAWGTYYNDDGIATLGFQSSMSLPANGTLSFLIVYTMSDYVKAGDTFAANVISVDGTGEASKIPAIVSNLPLATSTKTIIASPYQTSTTTTTRTTTITTTTIIMTTSTTTTTTTTTTPTTAVTPKDECTTKLDCKTDEECVDYACQKKPSAINMGMIIVIAIVAVVAVALLIVFFYLKSRRSVPETGYTGQRYS